MNNFEKKIRSFIAIDLSGEAKKELERVIDHLREKTEGIKWAVPATIHLTIKFLGSVTREEIEKVKSSLDEIALCFDPFYLELNKLGGFPSLVTPKIIWAGLKKSRELEAVVARTEEVLNKNAFPKETRAYKPHITIGRVKKTVKCSLKDLSEIKIKPVKTFVNRMILYRSDLTKEGPIHTPVIASGFSKK